MERARALLYFSANVANDHYQLLSLTIIIKLSGFNCPLVDIILLKFYKRE